MEFSEGSVCRRVSTTNNHNNNNMTRSSGGRGNTSCNKSRKKKRFSDEQIRSLEFMFGSESKPDPGIKQQLAAELGLQPKQVAIWFQNRRARLKPKQIEQEYDNLKASYDALGYKFESLKKENRSLSDQARKLMEKFERVRMERNGRMSEPGAIGSTYSMEQACVQESKNKAGNDQDRGVNSNEDHKYQVVERQLSQVGGNGGGNNTKIPLEITYINPFTPSANSWSSEYSCFLDQSSCGSSKWWEFW